MFSVEQLVCNTLYDRYCSVLPVMEAHVPEIYVPDHDFISLDVVTEKGIDTLMAKARKSRDFCRFVSSYEHELKAIYAFSYAHDWAVAENLLPYKPSPHYLSGYEFIRDWDEFSVFCQFVLGIRGLGPTSTLFQHMCVLPLRRYVSNTVSVFDVLHRQENAIVLDQE